MIMPSKDNLYNGRKGIGFENPSYFEKAKDLRRTLCDEKVIGLGYTLMFLTHSDEALEIENFKRSRENKVEFAYDYGNLNANYVNEKINFENDYFQEIIKPDFEKIDSPFQQTSSLKPYVPNVILKKIIIDLEDEVVNLLEKEKRVRTDNGTEFKNKTLAKFFDEVGITQQFSAARTPQQNGDVERRNRTLVEAAKTMLTFANLPSFLWAKAIATACFIQNRLIIHKRFDKTPYELINKIKPNIKFFRVFGCRCYLLNDYEDVGKLKAKGGIRVFVGYSKESPAFRIYNKRTRKIHESVNVNFDDISEMASKQFSLEPGLSNLNETGKSSNQSVLKVDKASKKDLEDLFHDFYDDYFDSSKIMKSSTTNVETSINDEISESFQGESSSSSLNDDVKKSPEEVILHSSNTQSIPINMIPNGDEASTSHNVFNERLEDVYFDATKAMRDADWVSAMQEEFDQFARLKIWRLAPRTEGKSVIKTKWIFKNKKDES
nr:retrovirus-related Pol polyprotein from transposon TNT 1-94 [Tanacetum cinerariifolium]